LELENKKWQVAVLLAVAMAFATGIGNLGSSYMLLLVKSQEEADKAEIATRAKGAGLHCEKLLESASLAAEIEFSADRGYTKARRHIDLFSDEAGTQRQQNMTLASEQLAFEKRASALIPMLSEDEAKTLSQVTLHNYVVTRMRTSTVPPEMRVAVTEGGFDANEELNGIREGGAALAVSYRRKCTE
jgi:hypothetical protein